MKRNLLILAFMSFGFSNGQNVFRDDFSAYSAPVNFSGSGTWSNLTTTGPGTGTCAGLGCLNSKILASTLSYTGYGSSANSAELKSNTDGVGTFFPSITTPDVYVGMVVNVTTVSATPSDNFRVFNNGSFTSVAFRMFFKQNGFDFQLGVSKGSGSNPIVYAPNLLTIGTDHLIILKFKQLSGATDDTVEIFIDPNYAAGQPATADAFNSGGSDQSGDIKMMAFRQNFSNLPTGKAGLISVSTTWAGLGFLPLSKNNFDKSTFNINASQANIGLLSVKSNVNLEKANLNIYDMQGRIIEQKNIDITENNNQIAINPISNAGVYIVEIISRDNKIAQKILIQ